ncbi:MAG: sulfurtransferase TusA family protein [Nitriliruptor sp.]|uniref:sulfurtransferase TusA family protein n=1 Tax=Nitriliruptor sp. TaxID=2448056 RepID=UPI00349FE881
MSDPSHDVEVEVDARGLACPLPVIELARAVEQQDVGAVVRLLATDPAAKVDVPVWCRMQRQELRSAEEADGCWTFLVAKLR